MTAGGLPSPVGRLLLGATIALALGMAWLIWNTSAIGSVLLMNHGVASGQAVLIERILSAALLVAVAGLASPMTRPAAAAAIFGVAVFFAWANVDQGGYPFSRFAYGAHALRMAAPAGLMLMILPWTWLAKVRRSAVIAVLVTASAITFIVHGAEALAAHPWWVDMTIGTFRLIGGWRVSQSSAETILLIVGAIDILVALALVLFRSRWAAGWMAIWGLFTAAIRVLNYGSGATGEFLVRLPQALLPFALVMALLPPAGSDRR